MSAKRWLVVIGISVVVAVSVFGVIIANVTTVERLRLEVAVARIDSVRTTFVDATPIVRTGDEGEFFVESAPADAPSKIRTLHVLAYRGPAGGLVQIDIPIWFLRMKDPAIQFVLRDAGVDLRELGLTAADLQRHGPRVVIDEKRTNGDHVLIWTQGQ